MSVFSRFISVQHPLNENPNPATPTASTLLIDGSIIRPGVIIYHQNHCRGRVRQRANERRLTYGCVRTSQGLRHSP